MCKFWVMIWRITKSNIFVPFMEIHIYLIKTCSFLFRKIWNISIVLQTFKEYIRVRVEFKIKSRIKKNYNCIQLLHFLSQRSHMYSSDNPFQEQMCTHLYWFSLSLVSVVDGMPNIIVLIVLLPCSSKDRCSVNELVLNFHRGKASLISFDICSHPFLDRNTVLVWMFWPGRLNLPHCQG